MMKKTYIRFGILFALTILFPTGLISTVLADTKAVGGVVFNYTISNGEAMILNAEKTVKALVMPDKLGGYPVTSIDENAFLRDKTIEKVTISDNVKNIKDQAFPGCPNLRTVVLGKGVVELRKHCFYDCTAWSYRGVYSGFGQVHRKGCICLLLLSTQCNTGKWN